MSYKINYTTEEKIKLAKDDSVEKLYQSKKNQRTVRVLTVLAYVLTVSLAGLVLSCYYIFFWKHPKPQSLLKVNNDIIIVPENIAIKLINGTDIPAEVFYNEIIKKLKNLHSDALKIHPKLTKNEFNRYIQESDGNFNSHTMDKKLRKKIIRMNNKKKIIDDEDLNPDMESSGDKDQIITTFSPPLTSESSDLNDLNNDTTIIFDQEEES
ncbi:hypothetical protein PVAND_001153 [Polypedilum vanderplanki]|uniref:Uncharacterized protein n=1 Tax=Polypedilum vanderplanki TaxID=319348 RepID=A0A9J6BM30_POLVA|nr:hypothetical protein PVAND_001153 [Polypedilum vanderplanki]